MAFVAIVAVTPQGRVAKYMDFATAIEADAHVSRFAGRFPKAFAAIEPNSPSSHWKIDMDAKTIAIDAPTPEPPPPESQEVQAFRELAIEIGAAAVALIEARFGTAP